MIAALSSTTYITELVFGVIFGFALYKLSSSFRQEWGRPPWSIPPWGWFVIGFVIGLIGMLVYLIAHFTTKGSIRRRGGAYGATGGYPQGYQPPPPAGYPPPPVPAPSQSPPGWAPPAGSPASPQSMPPAPAEQGTDEGPAGQSPS
jgi:hypothetical protein